jgi:hypothetical protein
MEKLNEKKIAYLLSENNEYEEIIKEIINNHENLFIDNEAQQLLFYQTNKIRDLQRKKKKLEEAHEILNNLYPLKLKLYIENNFF